MKKITVVTLASSLALLGLSACESDADKASRNVSKAAEQFEVQRRIVGINAITDKIIFDVEGRCSIERDGDVLQGALVVTCKHGPNDFRKHFVGLSDNVAYISTQDKGIDVSVYRTRIIIKPENIVPNLDLVTGERG